MKYFIRNLKTDIKEALGSSDAKNTIMSFAGITCIVLMYLLGALFWPVVIGVLAYKWYITGMLSLAVWPAFVTGVSMLAVFFVSLLVATLIAIKIP